MEVKTTYDPDNGFHHNQNIRRRLSDGGAQFRYGAEPSGSILGASRTGMVAADGETCVTLR